MRKFLLSVLVSVLMAFGIANAQDNAELKCSDAEIRGALDQSITALKEAKNQDSADALVSIVRLNTFIGVFVSSCYGLDFSGDGSVNSAVTDPVWIPAGTYRVTLDMPADSPDVPGIYIGITGTVLEGACDGWDTGWEITLFMAASHGDQTVLNSRDGCLLIWETEFINQPTPFAVKFEKLR